MATPKPEAPDHIPMAFALSCGSTNTSMMTARVAGITNAPPTPMTHLNAMSSDEEVENADIAEPKPNTAIPPNSIPLRP